MHTRGPPRGLGDVWQTVDSSLPARPQRKALLEAFQGFQEAADCFHPKAEGQGLGSGARCLG